MTGVGARAKAKQRQVKTPGRKVPSDMARALMQEAGGKCANPGCSAWRTHIHHVHEWHVHKTHDEAYMIAVCPTCHDQIHHGEIEFSDELLLQWKLITRPASPKYTHLYVEPGGAPAFQLGSIYTRSNQGGGMTFLEAGNGTRLGLRVPDKEITEVDLVLCDAGGKKLIETKAGNHIRLGDVEEEVEVRVAPGAIEVWVPADRRFIPDWLPPLLARFDPQLIVSGKVMLAFARVVEPSVVRIGGIWPLDEHRAIVLDDEWVIPYDRFVVARPSRFRAQPDKKISMTFDERVTSVFSQFKLTMSGIFGKRNFLRLEPSSGAYVFQDGSAIRLHPLNTDINSVEVSGPSGSTADYFRRFLAEIIVCGPTRSRCRFQDGSMANFNFRYQ